MIKIVFIVVSVACLWAPTPSQQEDLIDVYVDRALRNNPAVSRLIRSWVRSAAAGDVSTSQRIQSRLFSSFLPTGLFDPVILGPDASDESVQQAASLLDSVNQFDRLQCLPRILCSAAAGLLAPRPTPAPTARPTARPTERPSPPITGGGLVGPPGPPTGGGFVGPPGPTTGGSIVGPPGPTNGGNFVKPPRPTTGGGFVRPPRPTTGGGFVGPPGPTTGGFVGPPGGLVGPPGRPTGGSFVGPPGRPTGGGSVGPPGRPTGGGFVGPPGRPTPGTFIRPPSPAPTSGFNLVGPPGSSQFGGAVFGPQPPAPPFGGPPALGPAPPVVGPPSRPPSSPPFFNQFGNRFDTSPFRPSSSQQFFGRSGSRVPPVLAESRQTVSHSGIQSESPTFLTSRQFAVYENRMLLDLSRSNFSVSTRRPAGEGRVRFAEDVAEQSAAVALGPPAVRALTDSLQSRSGRSGRVLFPHRRRKRFTQAVNSVLGLVDALARPYSFYPYTHAVLMGGMHESRDHCARLYRRCPTSQDQVLDTFNNMNSLFPGGLPQLGPDFQVPALDAFLVG